MFRKMLLSSQPEKHKQLDPEALARLEHPVASEPFTLQNTQEKPEEPTEGGIMSIFKMKHPEGAQLKGKEKDLIEQRRAKLRMELSGRA